MAYLKDYPGICTEGLKKTENQMY